MFNSFAFELCELNYFQYLLFILIIQNQVKELHKAVISNGSQQSFDVKTILVTTL